MYIKMLIEIEMYYTVYIQAHIEGMRIEIPKRVFYHGIQHDQIYFWYHSCVW